MLNLFTYGQLVITPLTQREIEVLDLVSKGYSNEDIAEILVIALSTVKCHYNHILNKFNVDWNDNNQNSIMRLRVGLIWQKYKSEIVQQSKKEGLLR